MAAQAHGGWNGSRHGVVDVGTNAEALKAAGTTGANLRYTGFNDAATRLMSDRDRKLAADQSNQGVDYNVATGNADRSQQNTQFNAGADNAMRSFNAGLLQDAEGRNAGMETDTSRFNAGNTNDIGKFGAGLLADLEQFNAGSENSMGQFNAGMAADADRFNATADNERDTFNAQTGTNVNLANTGARNAGLLADQGAGLAGADLNLRGGSMLGDLSKTQLNELLTKGGAVRQVGQDQQGQQQAQDDANFSDYTRSLDWLLQMLNGRRAALGMQPIQQTQTSDGKTTEQTSMGLGSALLGSLGSLASAGSMGLFGSGMSNWMNGTGGGAVPLNPTTFSVPMQMGGGSAYGRV